MKNTAASRIEETWLPDSDPWQEENSEYEFEQGTWEQEEDDENENDEETWDDEDSHWEQDDPYWEEERRGLNPLDEAWGIASAIDIYECSPDKIRDADEIRRFVVELCELIEMKRFGETQVVHFGEDEKVAGYSMVQLIETSLISAHFANLTNAVYLDVFSCKAYDTETVRKFAQDFFGGSRSNISVTMRH